MLKASFLFEAGTDKIRGVEMSGHSDFGTYGNDVVCASASVLVLSTINALEEYVGINTQAVVESGLTSFSIVTETEVQSIQAQAIAHSFYMAMTGLEEEYSDFIEVTISMEENDND